jgi:hypothetical protein
MEEDGQLDALAALPVVNKPSVPTEKEAEWVPESVWT